MDTIFALIAVGLVIVLCLGGVGAGIHIGWIEGEDGGDRAMGGMFILLSVLTLCLIGFGLTNHGTNKPCARYETGYAWNAGTKTTMPYRYCTQYGEWITPEPGS